MAFGSMQSADVICKIYDITKYLQYYTNYEYNVYVAN